MGGIAGLLDRGHTALLQRRSGVFTIAAQTTGPLEPTGARRTARAPASLTLYARSSVA